MADELLWTMREFVWLQGHRRQLQRLFPWGEKTPTSFHTRLQIPWFVIQLRTPTYRGNSAKTFEIVSGKEVGFGGEKEDTASKAEPSCCRLVNRATQGTSYFWVQTAVST